LQRADPVMAWLGVLFALLWATAVVIAAQGDPVPESVGGHLVMLAGFAWAVVVFGTVAGSLGAFFVDERRERQEAGRSA
jgi:protein-S-isoprenylcysteine O-methyltransferase Ste14